MNTAKKPAEKDLQETVEFYQPENGLDLSTYLETEDKQGIHHLGRYHWAKQVLHDFSRRSILDIACGAGYGSYLIADQIPEARVTGGDYDQRAVAQAGKRYQADNLRFIRANLVTWESGEDDNCIPLGKFDAIVSFDTIEHLLHREVALLRIADNLTNDGLLLLSTPCHSAPTLNPGWEHHKIEYSFRDLQGLLKRFFEVVLIPEDGSLPRMEFWTNVINRDRQRYLNRTNPIVCRRPIRVRFTRPGENR